MPSELGALVPLLLAWTLALPGAEPQERILAVVDGQPVLLSEVRLVQLLRGLPPEAALEEAIDERLMFEQAARLPQTAATGEEEERAYAALRDQLPGDELPDEALLREMARRQTTILKYVDFRFRPLLRVDESASEQPDEAARTLAAELDQRIEAWVAELREAAAIRYNPAPPPGAS